MVSLNKKLMISISIRVSIPIGKITFLKNDAPTYQANLSIQGGSNKTMYYVSGSYYFQDGITPRSEYNRYTFRSNLESRPTDWLRFWS